MMRFALGVRVNFGPTFFCGDNPLLKLAGGCSERWGIHLVCGVINVSLAVSGISIIGEFWCYRGVVCRAGF